MSPESAQYYMRRALHLAALGLTSTHPNPRVGCVIVRDGRVVGEGWHRAAGEPHAEVHALAQAKELAQGAEVFVSLEPCAHFGRTPPCAQALVRAKPQRVWVAMQDPNPKVAGKGLQMLRDAGIAVELGLLASDAEALNRGFLSRMRRARPWVTVKIGASLDGRTAMASGESQWITCRDARADVHRMRAEAGAVLTSSATVLADDPALTVRNYAPAAPAVLRQPARIVLDASSKLRLGVQALSGEGRRLLVTSPQGLFELSMVSTTVIHGVEVLAVPMAADGRHNLEAVLSALAEREINEVLVEAGAGLSGAFLQAGLVDELVVYLAPKLLGHEGRPLALLPGLSRLSDHVALSIKDSCRVGNDLKITFTPSVR